MVLAVTRVRGVDNFVMHVVVTDGALTWVHSQHMSF